MECAEQSVWDDGCVGAICIVIGLLKSFKI